MQQVKVAVPMPSQVNLYGAAQILPFVNLTHSAETNEGPTKTAAAAARMMSETFMVGTFWLN